MYLINLYHYLVSYHNLGFVVEQIAWFSQLNVQDQNYFKRQTYCYFAKAKLNNFNFFPPVLPEFFK